MNLDFSEFHFIRPLWLGLMALLPLLWYFARNSLNNTGWERYLPKQTIDALRMNSTQNPQQRLRWWLAGLLVLILAGAGPTWVKQPVPVLKNQRAMVVILDLSPSMLAEDLKPERLTRAKFKLIDILRKRQDGQTALIAYAGDAHTVSPLTDDPVTIEALLPALHPDIMPGSGSNTEAAIDLAQELLRSARVSSGQILLITDGIAPNAIAKVRERLTTTHRLSILGVGGHEAVPVPNPSGGFLRNNQNEIVLAGLNSAALSELASSSGGRFTSLQVDGTDVDFLLREGLPRPGSSTAASATSYDSWADMGHWLVLLVLPWVAFFFRKGLIYLIPLTILLPFDAGAADFGGLSWIDLWQTRDQQAARQLQQHDYSAAAEKFKRDDWAGIANYRSGNYSEAVKQFDLANSNQPDIVALYNKGNALAFSGNLQPAINTYDQVIALQPDHADAAYNKKVLEQLLQEQQEQQQQQSQQANDKNSDDQQEQEQEQPSSEQNSQSGDQQTENNGNEEPHDTDSQPQQSPTGNKQQSAADQQADEALADHAKTEQDRREKQAAEQQQDSTGNNDPTTQPTESEAGKPDEAGEEGVNEQIGAVLQDSSEQWLRSIQDDPSGLLRRKFEYQSWQNAQRQGTTNESADNPRDRY